MMLLAAILIALICNSGGQLQVFMQNAKETQPNAFAVEVAADAKVYDLAQALLQTDAQTTGLPKGFITADGIKISYSGQELKAGDVLADAGICAESLLHYDVEEVELTFINETHFDGNVTGWSCHIPVGYDLMDLMVQQMRDHLSSFEHVNEIPDGCVIRFVFLSNVDNETWAGSVVDQMQRIYWLANVVVHGNVRIIETSLLNDADEFDWQMYDNNAAEKEVLVGGRWMNVIEKPTVSAKFPYRNQEKLILYHLVGRNQDVDEIKRVVERDNRPLMTVYVYVPESFTFLFDTPLPELRRLV